MPSAPLSSSDLWSEFCRLVPRFPFIYAAFLHLRAAGWMCRPGLQFGADFVYSCTCLANVGLIVAGKQKVRVYTFCYHLQIGGEALRFFPGCLLSEFFVFEY